MGAQQMGDSERAGPVGPALRISHVGHAGGPLVSAQNKKKAPGRELFLLFLAETVECVIIAETGMVTGFHRYSQIPYPHSYPQKIALTYSLERIVNHTPAFKLYM